MKKKISKSIMASLLAVNIFAVPVFAEENKSEEETKEIETTKNTNEEKENESVKKEVEKPEITGEYAATIDLETGELLYGKNENEQAYPASITKIMTALLLMENLKEDDVVTISNSCANITRSSSQATYVEGETMDRDTALYSMLVTSANDLACSIGSTIAGSEEEFAKMMTKRAKELGAVNTNFVTASGLDAGIEEHKTTAYDMALIAREAYKHEKIAKAMGTKKYEAVTSEQTVTVSNKNKIMQDENALGGKTGYTDKARNTLAKIDEIDGKKVINIVMKSNLSSIYDDIKNISEYGASQLTVHNFEFEEEVEVFSEKVKVKSEEEITLNLVNEKDKEKVKLEFEIDKKIKENEIVKDEVKTGDILGKVLVKYNGETIKEVNAVATEDVKFKQTFSAFSKESNEEGLSRSAKALIAILTPFVIYIGVMFYYNRKMIENRRKRK